MPATAERTRTATCSYCHEEFKVATRYGPLPSSCDKPSCKAEAKKIRDTQMRKTNRDFRERQRQRIADLEEENAKLRRLAGIGGGEIPERTEEESCADLTRSKLDAIAQDGPASQSADFIVAVALRAGELPEADKLDLKREVVRLAGAQGARDTSQRLVELCAVGVAWGARLRGSGAADAGGRLAA